MFSLSLVVVADVLSLVVVVVVADVWSLVVVVVVVADVLSLSLVVVAVTIVQEFKNDDINAFGHKTFP